MPLLEQIVRMQAPRKPISTIGVLVWSGQLERAGNAPSLLDWNRQGVTYYGHSQLHRAVMQGMPSRGLGIHV